MTQCLPYIGFSLELVILLSNLIHVVGVGSESCEVRDKFTLPSFVLTYYTQYALLLDVIQVTN